MMPLQALRSNLLLQVKHQIKGLASRGRNTVGSDAPALEPGQIIDDRYEIVRAIAQGGFGRTYLAKDARRHGEQVVLKEFSPQVGLNQDAIAKARQLFEREALVLHQLKHPQIPEFREVFEAHWQGQTYWILVQSWINGPTYEQLLARQRFSEMQVRQFLEDILPVLDTLHHHNPPVIHRDIALDNLIYSTALQKPVLIDFGTVKQAVAAVTQMAATTQIAKQGYSPREQTQGHADPTSDLYALAVCALALLTGQTDPATLYNAHDRTWNWKAHATITPELGSLLTRMLQDNPSDRYASATAVLNALQNRPKSVPSQFSAPTQIESLTQIPATVPSALANPAVPSSSPSTAPNTIVVAPLNRHPLTQVRHVTQFVARQSWRLMDSLGPIVKFLVLRGSGPILLVSALYFGYVQVRTWIPTLPTLGGLPQLPTAQPQIVASADSNTCQAQVEARHSALGLSGWQEVDRRFYRRYPNLPVNLNPNNPAHQEYIASWCSLATQWLDEQTSQ